jgi:hypothetical protein
MQFLRHAHIPTAFILLTLNLTVALPVVAQDTAPRGTVDPASHSGNALDRAMRESAVKAEKMRLYLQPAMRRNGLDMWIIMSREFHPDPMLDLFGGYGISGWYGHRNAYVFYDPGGDQPLESVIFGTHQSDHMLQFFDRIESYGEEGLKPHLREYVQMIDPQTIAINRSRTVAMADGITAELLAYLEDTVGDPYVSRLRSSESLIFDYVGIRTDAELDIEREASWRTWNILKRAFYNEVVTPGRTTLMDVWGWIVDEWKSQHLEFNFPPGLTIYRRGEDHGLPASSNPVILSGDVLHVDFGVRLMGLVTDQQHLAYVLHPGEEAAPKGLRDAFDRSAIVAQIYAEELKPGTMGTAVKENVERRANSEGIDALVYGHTQGNWVHGVGARTVFNWPDRYGIFAEKPVKSREFWSIEFRTISAVPEWDGQLVPMAREEDAWIDLNGKAHFITGPQQELWLIRSRERANTN